MGHDHERAMSGLGLDVHLTPGAGQVSGGLDAGDGRRPAGRDRAQVGDVEVGVEDLSQRARDGRGRHQQHVRGLTLGRQGLALELRQPLLGGLALAGRREVQDLLARAVFCGEGEVDVRSIEAAQKGLGRCAGEEAIEGVTGRNLCQDIRDHGHREVFCSRGKKDAIAYLKENLKPGDVLLTLGAGDVWKVGPDILKALST